VCSHDPDTLAPEVAPASWIARSPLPLFVCTVHEAERDWQQFAVSLAVMPPCQVRKLSLVYRTVPARKVSSE
jgi:hypothetical protein